jgi:hypothetical protein
MPLHLITLITMKKILNPRSLFSAFALTAICLAASCSTSEKTLQAAPQNASAVSVKLSENGRALLPIILSDKASEAEKTAAQTLAEYLKRITGGEFKVETAAAPLTGSTPGIAVGVASNFSDAPAALKTDDATKQEDYLLRSHAAGVLLIGASEKGVQHAVWDFLYRLGYRQFFPGETWEVIPSTPSLSVAVNVLEHPDYYARRIWPGFGALPENRESYAAWEARNRMGSGVELRTGHAYGAIIHRNKAAFAAHPEYLTKPGGDKFCVSDPGLQKLVIDDALAQFEKDPTLQSVSLDPSDGGGWESDSCPDAKEIGSVTDRAITLANVVAEAVSRKYPDKFIGLYAYNEHSPPPTIKVHPRVVVSIATGFIRGGYSMDELLKGWSEKAKLLGIREYYSVRTWDNELPGRSRGSNLDYLAKTLPDFHAKNARFFTSETSDSWGMNGLGHYIAARLLWDVNQAQNIDALTNDFLEKAFGSAKKPMVEFYNLINGANKPLLSADLIGRLYRQLNEAMQSTPDAKVRARLNDLALYVRYVELFSEYSQANGAARQAAFEKLLRFSWRIRTTHMEHTLALWRDLDGRDKTIKIPEEAGWRIPEPQNPWKSSEPFSEADIQTFISQGIANNKLLEFTPQQFSDELIPATPLQLSSGKPGSYALTRNSQDFYTWVEKAPATIELESKAGQIYQDRGPAKIELFPLAEAEMKSVASAEVAPDKTAHTIQLQTTFPGLHRINLTDGSAGTSLKWAEGTPMTIESSLENPNKFAGGRWTMYFYVPKGASIVGGFRNTGAGQIRDADGKPVLTFVAENNPGYWSVPVAPGQDGKLWQLYSVSGQVMLMTTPPYLARSAEELLLPREVVEKDAAH